MTPLVLVLLLATTPAGTVTVTPAPPTVQVTVTDISCAETRLTVTAPAGTNLTGYYDIGDIPPIGSSGAPVHLRLPGTAGTRVHWGIATHASPQTVLAEGWHTIPPCLAPAPVPVVERDVQIGEAISITRPAPRRLAFWSRMVRMGAW
jgi:hypothetical protein